MEILEIRLTNKERENLYNDLSQIIYPANNYCKYLNKIKLVLNKHYSVFEKAMSCNNLSHSSPKFYGVIKFVNLPIDKNIIMPPTDSKNLIRIEKKTYLSENLLLLIGQIFGESYSMHFEGKGLINNLIPVKNSVKDLTGLGSDNELGFHIENSALKFLAKKKCSPKALLLIGVRQQKRPPYTPISDARDALDILSSKDIELLSNSNYKIKLPYRWRINKEYSNITTEYIPIIESDKNAFCCNGAFYGDMIQEIKSEEAKVALDSFIKALYKTMRKEIVNPGEVICLDNRVIYHSRFPYDAKFNKSNQAYRWIQRVFICENLSHFDDWKELA